ncbi:hypothetical protein D4764_09G0003820 [Takifugu flavidus]|uniref:Uncharacterized protein n=1 Tax=Takifugu flavidus TaxID=433684 RepID=A0A5C6MKH1_9TELE|nr:hypothetical protein D4764_09G0003820 [Takifugu flavidus]
MLIWLKRRPGLRTFEPLLSSPLLRSEQDLALVSPSGNISTSAFTKNQYDDFPDVEPTVRRGEPFSGGGAYFMTTVYHQGAAGSARPPIPTYCISNPTRTAGMESDLLDWIGSYPAELNIRTNLEGERWWSR